MKTVNIHNITIDQGTQARAQINEETVSEYAEAMQAGDEFPPITLFDDGVNFYLADGFHRLFAVKRLGKTSISANLEKGTLRDAILFSLSANNQHGLRRSNADKRKAVETLLDDFEWGTLSVNQMADICAVSPALVQAVKEGRDKGTKVSTVEVIKPKKDKKVKLDNVVEVALEPAHTVDEAVQELVQENQRLADRLAVEAMEASPEEKTLATETIASLREQIRLLEIENQSLKIARDTFQRENAELKKTVQSLQRKLKKEE